MVKQFHPWGRDAFKRQVTDVMKRIENQFAESVNTDMPAAEMAVYELQFMDKLLASAGQLEEKLLEY